MSQVGAQAVQVGGQAVVDLRDLEGMVPRDAEVLQFPPWLPPAKAKRSSPTAHGVFYSAALLLLDRRPLLRGVVVGRVHQERDR